MTKHTIEKMTTTYINSNIYTFSYKYYFILYTITPSKFRETLRV